MKEILESNGRLELPSTVRQWTRTFVCLIQASIGIPFCHELRRARARVYAWRRGGLPRRSDSRLLSDGAGDAVQCTDAN